MNPIWTAPADYDADWIWTHIASDNIDAADRTIARLQDAASRLTVHPLLGRNGKERGTRELVVSRTPYILIYGVNADRLEILRVLHGKQHWPPEG